MSLLVIKYKLRSKLADNHVQVPKETYTELMNMCKENRVKTDKLFWLLIGNDKAK
jgi:hypothetical protein